MLARFPVLQAPLTRSPGIEERANSGGKAWFCAGSTGCAVFGISLSLAHRDRSARRAYSYICARNAVCRHTVTQNGRADKHHQLRFSFLSAVDLNRLPINGICPTTALSPRFLPPGRPSDRQHNQLTIVSQHGSLQFALAKHTSRLVCPSTFDTSCSITICTRYLR